MSTITKIADGKRRRHAHTEGKLLCGVDRNAAKGDYQVDLADDVDCKDCLRIMELLDHHWMRAKRGSWSFVPRGTAKDQFNVCYRSRTEPGLMMGFAVMMCDARLAQTIVDGLNAVYPPPNWKNRKKRRRSLTGRFEI